MGFKQRGSVTRRPGRRTFLACALAGAALAVPSTAGAAEVFVGATDGNRLVSFASDSPGKIRSSVAIKNLASGERVLGLDIRPATGQLYALGSSSRLYVVDRTSGAATAVGTSPFSIPLSGSSFGFDFNPTVDRIRIVSDTGQNLRAHPDLGTIVDSDMNSAGVQPDGNLSYASTDAGAGQVPSPTGAAYTNSVAGATTTQLFVIDTARDFLALQNPPNNGTLNTIGALAVDVGSVTGFDITAPAGVGYAAITRSGQSRPELLRVNLQTGEAVRAVSTRSTPAIGIDGINSLAAAGTVADDRTKPRLVVRASRRQSASRLRQGRTFGVRASCNEACRLTASLRFAGRTVGFAPGEIRGSAGVRTLRLKVNSSTRRALRRDRTRRLQLTVRATDAAGNRTTSTRTITTR